MIMMTQNVLRIAKRFEDIFVMWSMLSSFFFFKVIKPIKGKVMNRQKKSMVNLIEINYW